MTDYRTLSSDEKKKVNLSIINELEHKHHINVNTGFEWDEPEDTLYHVHRGEYCAVCWRSHYTCLCSHEN